MEFFCVKKKNLVSIKASGERGGGCSNLLLTTIPSHTHTDTATTKAIMVGMEAAEPLLAVSRGGGGSVEGRDPVLVQFEQSLFQELDALMKRGNPQDYVIKDEQGVFLYNANQCAYIIEACQDSNKRNNTRQRVQIGLDKIASSMGGWPEGTAPRYLQLEGLRKGEFLIFTLKKNVCLSICPKLTFH